MSNFLFNLSPNIIAGTDVLISLGENVAKYGLRFMLIIDPSFKDVDFLIKVKQSLEQKGLKVFSFDDIGRCPDTETVSRALKLASAACIDGVVVVGDIVTCSVAKAVAALYNQSLTIYEYLDGGVLTESFLPLIQIPTGGANPFLLSGTVYLTDSRNRAVAALRCVRDFSSVLFFDSNVFKGLSLNSLRMKIFSSFAVAIDAYVSRRSNFFSDALLKQVISLLFLALNLENGHINGGTIEEILMQASVLSAVALPMSSSGLAIAMASVCNSKYGIPFYTILTVMSSYVLRDSIPSNLTKVAEISRFFIEDSEIIDNFSLEDIALKGCQSLYEKLLSLELPAKIGSLDLAIEDMAGIAECMLKLDFMNYIPRSMAFLDVLDFLKKSY